MIGNQKPNSYTINFTICSSARHSILYYCYRANYISSRIIPKIQWSAEYCGPCYYQDIMQDSESGMTVI